MARASREELEAALATVGTLPAFTVLKAPETGTVMIEGRAGGGGRRFNLGEATVTRAVLRLADGRMGYAYALGSDRRKAEVSALLDALLQDAVGGSALLDRVIAPLARRQAELREIASRKAAATKVDFFTLVRGHA